MKKIVIVIVAAVLFSCNKSSDPAPSNLLANGNMEAGSSTVPNVWWHGGTVTNYILTWSTEQFSSSSHSLKISNANADPSNFTFWGQTYQGVIPVGKDIIFNVKIKSNLTGTGISIAIRGDDTATPSGSGEQFVTTQGITTISGTSDWTSYQVKMVNVQSNIKSLTVYMVYLQDTTGEVYFDDATLTQ